MNTTHSSIVRVNITLPKHIWHDLENLLPKRGKSNFIADAIEDKLQKEKRLKVFEELVSLPPAFSKITNSAAYIHNMRRKEDKKRRKKLDITRK